MLKLECFSFALLCSLSTYSVLSLLLVNCYTFLIVLSTDNKAKNKIKSKSFKWISNLINAIIHIFYVAYSVANDEVFLTAKYYAKLLKFAFSISLSHIYGIWNILLWQKWNLMNTFDSIYEQSNQFLFFFFALHTQIGWFHYLILRNSLNTILIYFFFY